MIMAMDITHVQDIIVISLPQRFDANNAPEIESEFRTLLAGSPRKVLLDFSRADYIASAGLRVLLLITRDQMKAGGKIVLAGIKPQVHKVFEMAGFTSIFTIRISREEAIRTLS